MFTPLLLIIYYQPFQLHCKLRFDRDWHGKTPVWCYDKVPNVYTYIQDKYWENGFGWFFYRGLENALKCIPMNLIYLTVTYRVMKSNALAFCTLGILGCKPNRV